MENNLNRLFSEQLKFAKILIDEPMKNHTSFKIGGPVDVMVIPRCIEELVETINICKKNDIDYYIIGNGTNLLVSDKGIRGVVIKISEGLGNISVEGTTMKAQAGALVTVASKIALKNSLTGLEFASGIPGSIGGAVTMNAGAYGGEMKDIVTKVKCLDEDGNIVEYTGDEMNFRYRGSRIGDENLIVLEAEMELQKGNFEKIEKTMRELTEKRNSKQPLQFPSGGSTFKRPEGYFAGKLIDDSGLRGVRYGDAQISDKHCGFIVNLGNASCKDVLTLIQLVQKVVKDNFDVCLEPEIKIIGEK
ncbi:MAG: UDP-N-acetylmuramate dehydrogenase [Sporanaerobacter sp.]|uniref:UDP-N-acetylmuramate dehydrogenase n=1 Tax=Sporanaerobacter sp. TaxID=2010183 RepID=UPI003A0FCEAF